MVFGIEDKTYNVIGTTFDHNQIKGKGNYDLELWLFDQLNPKHEFEIKDVCYGKKRLIVFFIKPALNGPLSFLGEKYIRIGSNQKKLSSFSEKESVIWERRTPFEKKISKEGVTEKEVLSLLDYDKYYQMTGNTLPTETSKIIDKFIEEEFIFTVKFSIY